LVSQPLVDERVILGQEVVQPVAAPAINCFEETAIVLLGLPAQVRVMVEPVEPPLYKSSLVKILDCKILNDPDLMALPLKEKLLVVNFCQGDEMYHLFVPQSIRPAGYCPFMTVSVAGWSLKVTVMADGAGVEIGVGVGVGVGIELTV